MEDRRLSDLLGPRGGLVVFWATWNPRSPQVLQFLAASFPPYRAQGLRVIPVNVEHEDMNQAQVADIERHYAAWGLPWPTFLDAGFDAFAAFGVITHPTCVYVTPDLRIHGVYPGFPAEALEALPTLIEKGLGIWEPAVAVRKPAEIRYQPKGSAGPLFQMGRLLFRRGQTRKALGKVHQATELDPDYALAFAAAAYLAGRTGRDHEAQAFLQALEAKSSSGPEFREAFALGALTLGQMDRAAEALTPLLDEEEPRPRGLVALAFIEAERGRLTQAEQILDRLGNWSLGGVPLEFDVREYVDVDAPPETRWSDKEAILLRLVGLRER
jgi:hypothetical protein